MTNFGTVDKMRCSYA